jgi:hypothetical protein
MNRRHLLASSSIAIAACSMGFSAHAIDIPRPNIPRPTINVPRPSIPTPAVNIPRPNIVVPHVVPHVSIPKVSSPTVSVPHIAPHVDVAAPKVSSPTVSIRHTDAPHADVGAPKVPSPKIDAPKISVSKPGGGVNSNASRSIDPKAQPTVDVKTKTTIVTTPPGNPPESGVAKGVLPKGNFDNSTGAKSNTTLKSSIDPKATSTKVIPSGASPGSSSIKTSPMKTQSTGEAMREGSSGTGNAINEGSSSNLSGGSAPAGGTSIAPAANCGLGPCAAPAPPGRGPLPGFPIVRGSYSTTTVGVAGPGCPHGGCINLDEGGGHYVLITGLPTAPAAIAPTVTNAPPTLTLPRLGQTYGTAPPAYSVTPYIPAITTPIPFPGSEDPGKVDPWWSPDKYSSAAKNVQQWGQTIVDAGKVAFDQAYNSFGAIYQGINNLQYDSTGLGDNTPPPPENVPPPPVAPNTDQDNRDLGQDLKNILPDAAKKLAEPITEKVGDALGDQGKQLFEKGVEKVTEVATEKAIDALSAESTSTAPTNYLPTTPPSQSASSAPLYQGTTTSTSVAPYYLQANPAPPSINANPPPVSLGQALTTIPPASAAPLILSKP